MFKENRRLRFTQCTTHLFVHMDCPNIYDTTSEFCVISLWHKQEEIEKHESKNFIWYYWHCTYCLKVNVLSAKLQWSSWSCTPIGLFIHNSKYILTKYKNNTISVEYKWHTILAQSVCFTTICSKEIYLYFLNYYTSIKYAAFYFTFYYP